MKLPFLLLISSFLIGHRTLAAVVSLTGTVKDRSTGQTIPGAEVYFPDLRTGSVTDINGHYSVNDLPATKTLVKVSMVGYAAITETIDLATVKTRDFLLSESVTEMNDVVVTGASKATELKRDPVPITLVSRQYLRENASTNAIEALSKVPGVSTLSTGPNVSKPYIRGLGHNRVLTLFDGVRQEGQQWGDEHGVEVDQFLIDHIEVVKGPASLMYGSDALAGVVNLLPAPVLPAGTLKGSALGVYGTNNRGISASTNLDGNNGKLAYGGRLSAKVASDYKNRFDGRVYGTKYNEKDLDAYLGINRSWGYARANFSLYDNQQEIPDGSRDSTSRRFTYQVSEDDTVRPIASDEVLNSYDIAVLHQRVQYYRGYVAGSVNTGRGRLTANLGFTRSIRREYSHPEYPAVAGLYLTLNTLPYDFKYHFPVKEEWETTAGLNGMFQVNDAAKGTELVIPSYRQSDIGPFLHTKKTLGKFDVSGGLRYDLRNYRNDAMFTRPDPATGFNMATRPDASDSTVVKQFDASAYTFHGGSGSVGAAWNLNERLTLKANIGRGYRAPSAAENSAKGVHPSTGFEQLGDADLIPEFNLQEDLGVFYAGTHVTASAEVFNNRISNYICNEKLSGVNGGDSLFTLDGQDFPVFKFKQTGAQLYGGEISMDIHPHPLDRLHVENSLSVIMARNMGGNGAAITDSTKYLPLIPPLHTNSALRYDLRDKAGCFARLFIKVGVQVFAAQDRFFGAFGTETYTPGYTLLDAGIGGDVVNKGGRTLLSFTAIGTNLADVGYQSNMNRLKYFDDYPVNGTGRSGIHNMGRNITIKVVVPIDLKAKAAPAGGQAVLEAQ